MEYLTTRLASNMKILVQCPKQLVEIGVKIAYQVDLTQIFSCKENLMIFLMKDQIPYLSGNKKIIRKIAAKEILNF